MLRWLQCRSSGQSAKRLAARMRQRKKRGFSLLQASVLSARLTRGEVSSMKKELIAAHLTLGFASRTGLPFRQSSTLLCLRSKNI